MPLVAVCVANERLYVAEMREYAALNAAFSAALSGCTPAARVAVQRERVRQKGAAPATHTPDRVSAAAEGATQSGV